MAFTSTSIVDVTVAPLFVISCGNKEVKSKTASVAPTSGKEIPNAFSIADLSSALDNKYSFPCSNPANLVSAELNFNFNSCKADESFKRIVADFFSVSANESSLFRKPSDSNFGLGINSEGIVSAIETVSVSSFSIEIPTPDEISESSRPNVTFT